MDDYKTLFRRLSELSENNFVPMHMPGHKRNTAAAPFLEALGAKYDISEIDGFDDLHKPDGVLKNAMKKAAELWKSENSFFLVNGSTGGILAAIRAAARATGSKKIIMARNCHRSVYNAVELLDLEPIYLAPPTVKGFGFCGSIAVKDVELSIQDNPMAPVILTSPTYEGVISNISEISIICHMYGSPLIVDEAHGAHLDLSPNFKGGAVRTGADIVVQSIHKTMAGLNQTALLHLNSELVSVGDIRRELAVFQTSSPSYPLMASIDGTVALIEAEGAKLFREWARRLNRFDREAAEFRKLQIPGHGELFDCQVRPNTPGYVRRGVGEREVYAYDRSKIIISCENTNVSGVELVRRLRERFGVFCEMATGGYAVAMTGLLNTDEHFERFTAAVKELNNEIMKTPPRIPAGQVPIPPKRMRVSVALSEPSRALSLRDAVGKIAAEYVWAYPPGIPLIVPGEELTEEIIAGFVRQKEAGVALNSTSEGMPRTVKVIRSGVL